MTGKEWVVLADEPELKNVTKSGKARWVEVTIYPDDVRKDILFPLSHLKVDESGEVWITEWILEQREADLGQGQGILLA